jgi:enediyne biosynthesis protein E4
VRTRHGANRLGLASLISTLAIAATLLGAGSDRTVPMNPAAAASPIRLRNIAESAGISFVYRNSPTADKHFVESAPGGLAVFDYNNDGRPDIFFTNGAPTPALVKNSPQYSNRLYRNDGGLRFTDVTAAAGVEGVGYAMGAAAGDYDNDGHVDVFVAGVRQNQLLHNRGDGRFEDVTSRSGISSGDWAVAAVWFDYDKDGRLDLFVVNYVKWSPDTNRYCGDQGRGVRIYCHPRFFEGLPDRLYRNRGDGTFEDVSSRAGISSHIGKGMSAAIADVDHDGLTDLFVTNDTVPNFLFRNKGDGSFDEIGLLSGVSVPASGRPVSSMGVDVQDYDNDGWEDIFFTALAGETFPLFHNDGRGEFSEKTTPAGLAMSTARLSGWCAAFLDVDNDGWKDIFTANSHANDRVSDSSGWNLANSLWVNDGHGRFRDATAEAGLAGVEAGHRGCGVADFDSDGRLDIVVLVLGTNAELWHNETATSGRWLTAKLIGTKSNRDGIGARVTIGQQVRTMTTAIGYASSSHAGLPFGLGTATDPVRIEIQWPSGIRQVVEGVNTNRVIEIKEQ